jgi:hypothetical protein
LIAILVLAVLGGSGAALYVALTKRDRTPAVARQLRAPAHTQVPQVAPTSGSSTPAVTPPPSSGSSSGSSGSSGSNSRLPAVPRSQMRADIEQLLLDEHTDIVNGDYRAAWNLLSARKQAQYLREHGYGGWQNAQASLTPYLHPDGIHVTIDNLNPSDGVARVMVTGMSWSRPGASCSAWSGITWVKYEGGQWRYDPGFSTTPGRRAGWQSKFSQLLGGSC